MATNGIDLVDKDDTGSIFLALQKQVPYPTGTDADKHFHKVGTGDGKERHIGFPGNGSCQQGLTGTGRPDQQHPLGNPATKSRKLLGIPKIRDDLFQFVLSFINTGHVLESHLSAGIGHELGAALAEAHRLAAAGLHLANEENPHPDQKQNRPPGNQHGHPEVAFFFGLGLDSHSLGTQFLNQSGIARSKGNKGAIVLIDPLDILSLQGHAADLARINGDQKITIS